MMTMPQHLNRPHGHKIAYHATHGTRQPGFIWLGGFKSDMDGTKALALETWAQENSVPYIRFDYFGHGQSSGDFVDGTISRWLEDTLAVLDNVSEGPQVLVGSSMGGWLALLAALIRPEQITGLLLIAPAPDFTEDLMWKTYPVEVQKQLEAGIPYEEPTQYDDKPYIITPNLIQDGRQHLILREKIAIDCPVRIVHGQLDPDVPWQHSLKLAELLTTTDLDLTFVKNGDHRLSDEHGIRTIIARANELLF